MDIALLGYGRMGKAIEKIALERGHRIVLKIDESREQYPDELLRQADVAIDFSVPAAAVKNYRWCFELGVPVVSGTTGWLESWDEVIACAEEKKGGFFYASNFSVGVNLFFHLNKQLARIMGEFPEYGAGIEEIHHIHKLDAPSGTAISLATDLIANHTSYRNWQLAKAGEKGAEDVLEIRALREGEVPGIHTVSYRSAVDTIEIRHEAFSREGFAFGAVLAAEFMKEKTGIFGMKDLLKL